MKVLVVTGSSGGHIFPALSFINRLRKRFPGTEALLVMPKKAHTYGSLTCGVSTSYLPITAVTLQLSKKNLFSLIHFFTGSLQAFLLLVRFSPDVVVGFGSLVSVPIIIFAWLLRIKTVIHEQNVIPGKANRLLSKFCDKIALSFEETKKYLRIREGRIIVTGNPLRPELKRYSKQEALGFFGFDDKRCTVLVMGGSQGSYRINTVFVEALSRLPHASQFQVIHLAGKNDYTELQEQYRSINVSVRLYDFFEKMQYAYSACDFVICRSGATTLSEVMCYQIPAILIPYPYARRHQFANASLLEKKGAAIVIDDSRLNAQSLLKRILSLTEQKDALDCMRSAYAQQPKQDAASALLEAVMKLLYPEGGS